MFKNIKYLLGSLLIVGAMVACGGGGGGSSPNGSNGGLGDRPAESQPVESQPVESQPIESNPDNLPPIATAVNIMSSGFSSAGNKVLAGQTFQITATVTSGDNAMVNFTNAAGTPSSVIYSPSSCLASLSKPCTTVVTVGLGTAHTTTNNYATKISTTTSGAVLSTTSVFFAVATPELIVSKQPNPATIAVGDTTTVGFTIAPGSIPAGTGQITAVLGSYPLGVLQLHSESCTISYAQGKIISSANDCQEVSVTAKSVGSDAIVALANGFSSASSNMINVVQSGNLPYVLITTNLPRPGYSIAAGQKFEITATSYNGATAQVNFTNSSNTPNSVSNSISGCHLLANGSCSTTVSVGFGTAPVAITNGYATNINFTNTTQSLSNQEIKFGVYAPKLSFNKNSASILGILLLDKTVNREITIESSSIPAGAGNITVSINQNNSGIITYPHPFSTCKIYYADDQITTNNCKSLVYGNAQGNTTIQASSEYFENADDHITVSPYLVYVAEGGGTRISLYSAYAGVLTRLNKSVENLYAPSAMVRDISGQFLYVIDRSVDRLSMYGIDSATGNLSELNPFLVSTGLQPSAIAVNPNGSYLYVTNYASNTICVYKIDANTGQLTLAYTSATDASPSAVAVDPTGKYVYVLNAGSKNISPFSVNANGSLQGVSLPVTLNAKPTAITVEPTGNYLYVTTDNDSIVMYSINKTTGGLYSPISIVNINGIPTGITIDKAGKIAYVTSNLGNSVSIYSITPQNSGFTGGQLNYISKITTGTFPWSLSLDPIGQYAYVTNNLSNNLSMYSVNSSTGVLNQLSPPTVGTGSAPMGIGFTW